jgi:hypothetical protein
MQNEGFDLRTHLRGKDGSVTQIQPYRLVVGTGGIMRYERDGLAYHPNGEVAGKASIVSKAPKVYSQAELQEKARLLAEKEAEQNARDEKFKKDQEQLEKDKRDLVLEGSTLAPAVEEPAQAEPAALAVEEPAISDGGAPALVNDENPGEFKGFEQPSAGGEAESNLAPVDETTSED